MTNIFTAPKDTSQQMADSLPQGRAWGKKNISDSNTRLLINSLAVAHNRSQQQVQILDEQFRIDQTTDLISDWETSVGLPSDCFVGVEGTLEQRRDAVISRLKKEPLVTLAEMQAYVDGVLPDTEIILYPGEAYTGYPERATYTIGTGAPTNSFMQHIFPKDDYLGTVFQVGMWVKNVDVSTLLQISLRQTLSPFAEYGAITINVLPTEWTYHTFFATVPASLTGPNIEILFNVGGTEVTGQSLYFDDLRIGATTIAPVTGNWTTVGADVTLSYSTTFPGSVNKKQILVAEIQTGSETFSYQFVMPFIGGIDTTQLACVLNKIIPANVLLYITYV